MSLRQMLQINTVFLTHSHLDHVALLPMLADAIGPRRKRPLIVYGPQATLDILRENVFNFRLWPDYTRFPSPEKPYVEIRPVTVGGHPIEMPRQRKITPLPVHHAVPAVAYQFDSGQASFVFSGDTTYYEPFWERLNEIGNLHYLMIETTFLNKDVAASESAGHMRPELVAKGLSQLKRPVRVLITHMEPGNEEAIMSEIRIAAGQFNPERIARGQTFEF